MALIPPERTVSVHDLAKQIEKYRNGMQKILNKLDTPHESVEFVCLLGTPPIEETNERGKEVVKKTLSAVNARYLNYDKLLHSAFEAVSGSPQRKVKSLINWIKSIKAIDDYAWLGPMYSQPTPERSALMGRIKGKNTKPEIIVRRILHSNGFRFRLHRRGHPGTPDIVFVGRKKAIFVHGCFWHRHKGCSRCTTPSDAGAFLVGEIQCERRA